MNSTNVVVAQLGARMHYAVPRLLWQHGMLERLFTDVAASSAGIGRVLGCVPRKWRPARLERLLQRRIECVPAARVTSCLNLALYYAWAGGRARTDAERMKVDLKVGAWFGRCVARHGLGGARTVYGFNSASETLFRYARAEGARCVLEQTIAPRLIMNRILEREQERWPGWEPIEDARHLRAFCDREAAEWEMADLILCGSEFVRDGIAAAGGPVSKCRIVPYGVDAPRLDVERTSSEQFRVLFAGTVGLRKGAQYLHAAAVALRSAKIRFRVVGPIRVLPSAAAMLEQIAEVVGPVPRLQMASEYGRADVMVLPTLVEGSATVCYEAMAAGVPVITTPNAGSVIRDGIEGFIVNAGDTGALVGRIAELASDPERARQMGEAARTRAAEFGVARYGRRLVEALQGVAIDPASALSGVVGGPA